MRKKFTHTRMDPDVVKLAEDEGYINTEPPVSEEEKKIFGKKKK